MKKLIHTHCVGFPGVALWAFALLAAGCSASGSQFSGSGGGSSAGTTGGASGGSTSGTSGTATSGGGVSGTGASASGTGGTGATTAGTSGGASGSGASTSGTGGTGAGGTSAGGTGAGGTGAVAGNAGSSTTTGGGATSTVELIGPSAATCGAANATPGTTNATHGDGFVCVLNYPNTGPNVVGYWFDYPFTAATCNVTLKRPASNTVANPQVCFSGSACPATSGGGLGLALCDVHGIDVSTWPQLMMLESTSSLSSTLKSPFSGCNPGAAMTSVSWTVGSGSIPAGMSVLFDNAADVDVARVDNLAAGATSVAVPANVDTSKVASIKFSLTGGTNTSWNFCLTSLKVSLH